MFSKVWIAAAVASLVCFDTRADKAMALFADRGVAGRAKTVADLQKLLASQPGDWETRYALASVLLEQPAGLADVAEALRLLDGAETASAPNWLAMWSLARRQEAAVRLQELFYRDLAKIEPAKREAAATAPEFIEFLRQQIAANEANQRRLSNDLKVVLSAMKTSFTGEEVAADLRQFAQVLRDRWSYQAEKERVTGLSIDKNLAAALAEVRPKMSRVDAARVFRRFASRLQDGHTSVDLPLIGLRSELPFRARDTEQGLVIAEIAPEEKGLRLGDRVLAINGLEAEKIVADWAEQVSVSTAEARRANAIDLLNRIEQPPGCEVSVLVERGGREETIRCHTKAVGTWPWSFDAWRKDWITARVIQPGIGLLQIRTWAPEEIPPSVLANPKALEDFYHVMFRRIDAAFARVADCRDIIVDVRRNGGGSDALCSYVASLFTGDRTVQPYILRYRVAIGGTNGGGSKEADKRGFLNGNFVPASYEGTTSPAWKGRVWVLVDELSFSATDTFLHYLAARLPADRLQTIGRASNGGIGGPTPMGKLANTGATVTVSTCQAFDLDRKLLEGRPARIDHPVRWTR